MRNFYCCLLIVQLAACVAGCSEEQVQCCHGLPQFEAPLSRFDQRWNTSYYYNPAFNN